MIDPTNLVQKAKTSSFYLRLLNWGLFRMIPFNAPHQFKILELKDWEIRTVLPFIRKNLNHISGLHACALATISEFTTGLLLITKLPASKYRLILQKLEMDYHFQGKMEAYGTFKISQDWIIEHVIQPLKEQDSVVVPCEIKIHDRKGNHLTTGRVYWQIKDWTKVKTKV
jgi:acyl-coenzyme A thioesterase PaaI-like protein